MIKPIRERDRQGFYHQSKKCTWKIVFTINNDQTHSVHTVNFESVKQQAIETPEKAHQIEFTKTKPCQTITSNTKVLFHNHLTRLKFNPTYFMLDYK